MNEQISWDQTLVKKFSSSNHFKLLNQLRNEVIKYPLKKKTNIPTGIIKDNNLVKKNNISSGKEITSIQTSIVKQDINNNQSKVSFNNSKNFSIYNINKDSSKEFQEKLLSDVAEQHEDTSSSTFKDRLNQIDMK